MTLCTYAIPTPTAACSLEISKRRQVHMGGQSFLTKRGRQRAPGSNRECITQKDPVKKMHYAFPPLRHLLKSFRLQLYQNG